MGVSVAEKVEVESPKRQAILNAAADLFIAHGYGAVSMDAIARGACVSKATLYAHFESKARLFATIITEACQANFTADEMVTDVAAREPRAALTLMGQRALRFLLKPQAIAIKRIAVAECQRFPEVGQAFYDGACTRTQQRFGLWLEHEVRAGRLAVPDPELATNHWMALLGAGPHFRAVLGVPPPPSDDEIEQTVAAAVNVFLAAYGMDGHK